ncbi:MAG: TetR/AcrR family transcriptional regulator [Planctomycetia bacterium]|nr:TetR/AcrR family transcriptional regulator [Planctomycetia bacterium]
MSKGTAKRSKGDELWANRKEEILTQAAFLFAKHGYSETDTQLLAETIGVGKGTVYRYFSSKRELFLAAADRVMRMMRQRIDSSVESLADPVARITTGIGVFLAFFAEHPEFVELLIQERAQFKDRTKPTFMEHRAMNVERWRAIYRGLIAAERVRDIPVDRITDVIGNLLYGTIFTNYFSGQSKSVEIQAQDIIDVVFSGILTRQEQERQKQG